MALLTNINGHFAVEDDGAIQFNGKAGTSGYVLESRGDSSPPVWTDRDTGNVIGTGTENKVVRWNAAPAVGASQTIGDGPITFSSSGAAADATFAGNVGIGITPSTSYSGVEVLQLGKGMTIFGNTNDDRATMASNLILNTGTAFEYVMDGLAGKFSIEDGNMSYGTAPLGTAGQVATITEKFAIANTGDATFSGGIRVRGGASTPIAGEARLGGHASHGAQLYGQGTSTDLIFYNKNGSTVISVDTGTINTKLAGWLSSTSSSFRMTFNVADGDTFFNINHTGNEAWSFKCESLSGGNDVITIGTPAGTTEFDENGQIFSHQKLDVATAGGRLTGKSNRGYLASMHLEQVATGADGGEIYFMTAPSGTTAGVKRVVIGSNGLTTIKRTGITGVAKADMILQIGYEGNNGQNNLIGFGFNGGTNIPAYIGYTTTSGGGNTYGDLIFATRDVTTDTAPTERMRITRNGNVTFVKGADNDRNANSIKHASNDFLYIRGGAAGTVLADDGEDTRMILFNNGNVRFDAGAKDNAMIIEGTTGRVGIGATSPIVPLHIVGTAVNNPSNGNGGYEVMQVFDDTSYATGVGGGIGFGGNFTSSNSTIFSEIRGLKENATDSNYAGALTFSTRANGANITERMRIDSSGNLGIGETDPAEMLTVKGGNIRLESTSAGNNGILMIYDANTTQAGQIYGSSGDLKIYSPANVLFNQGGNVGIGAVPTSTNMAGNIKVLQIGQRGVFSAYTNSGNVYMSCNVRVLSNGNNVAITSGVAGQYRIADDQHVWYSAANANAGAVQSLVITAKIDNAGTFTVKGDVVAYGSPSDIRLKENIKPIESALDKVSKLDGVTFDWKEKTEHLDKEGNPINLQQWKHDIGFIAQDVQKVIPELVRENDNGMLSMRHQGIAPILLEAIKELKAEIEELKSNKCNCNK